MIVSPITLKMVKFPCGVCQKEVATKHKAICCDTCNKYVYIGCNNLTKTTIAGRWFQPSLYCLPPFFKVFSKTPSALTCTPKQNRHSCTPNTQNENTAKG